MLAKWSCNLLWCCLGLVAVTVQANPIDTASKELKQDEIPSEEFWLFMAEFSDEDQLVDPEDLAALGADKSLKLVANSQSSEQETSSAGNSEESL